MLIYINKRKNLLFIVKHLNYFAPKVKNKKENSKTPKHTNLIFTEVYPKLCPFEGHPAVG